LVESPLTAANVEKVSSRDAGDTLWHNHKDRFSPSETPVAQENGVSCTVSHEGQSGAVKKRGVVGRHSFGKPPLNSK
jgi:hypothetical protein